MSNVSGLVFSMLGILLCGGNPGPPALSGAFWLATTILYDSNAFPNGDDNSNVNE